MQTPKVSRISVVIPCYNEEDNIARCLRALSRQSLRPCEIIVVDNNCTDRTVTIARRFGGVRVVREKKQGLIAARNTGMSAARGDILARLDADSVPSRGWARKISQIMADPNIQAATGTGYFYDFPFKRSSRAFRNLFAISIGRFFLGHNMLWGSNMAVRAEAWRVVVPELCNGRDIMEDLDIAMHLADEFGTESLAYEPAMRADISVRRGAAGLMQNYFYITMWPKTLRGHRFRWFLAWPAAYFLTATVSPFINTVSRFYDGEKDRWTLSRRQFSRKSGFKRDNP